MSDELSDLRIQIDGVDEELLKLFNERARLAQRVGVVKNHSVIYRPER
ncbi:MAG: chorismate mutase, partial [Betaproteobacteria bacterium]